jgi:hypothetical protein
MTSKSLSILIAIAVLGGGLNSCVSIDYLRPEQLRGPCVEAAKLKIVKRSGTCQLLEEVSIRDYQQAVAEGHAWIEEVGLNDQQIIKIRQGMVWIGMPAEAARLAWGDPFYIRTLTDTPEAREEWIYSRGKRLYVSNGKVTAIDDSFGDAPSQPNPVNNALPDVS